MTKHGILSTTEGTSNDAFGAADWGLLIFSGVTWGSSFLFMAEALESFHPGMVTFLRVLFGFLTLSLFPSSRARFDRADWPSVALLGVTWMAFPLTLFPLAELRVSSAVAGMINGGVAVAVAAVATVLLRRLPGRIQMVGLGVGFLGLTMVSIPSFGAGASSTIGVVMLLVAVIFYGFAFNVAVPLQQKYGALPVLWRALMVSVVLTAPYGLVGWSTSTWSVEPVLNLLALGIGGTALAFVAATKLAGRVGSSRASIASYVTTPVAITLGVMFRGESVAALAIVGAVTTVFGAFLTSRTEIRSRNA
jgi:drug/metabolite transporter (DMT)-like permease